eukprot:Gb_13534 [translate_table: standard]
MPSRRLVMAFGESALHTPIRAIQGSRDAATRRVTVPSPPRAEVGTDHCRGRKRLPSKEKSRRAPAREKMTRIPILITPNEPCELRSVASPLAFSLDASRVEDFLISTTTSQMAPRASTSGALADAHLLYEDQEEIFKDEEEYKSDLMSLKASGLHKIVAKPEVLPCKDLFSMAVSNCVLKRGLLTSPARTVAIIMGSVFQDLYKMLRPDLVYDAETAKAFLKGRDLVKGVLKDWVEDPDTFRRRTHLDYPISHFRKGIRIGMLLLNRLWGEANTDHVNQHWVPLLGEIILNDRKSDLVEVIAYNLHKKWEAAKLGRSFFMASYIVDPCCAYLNFQHPLFLEWSSPLGAPIHVLFSALISERVREDLRRLGAWWLFEDFTFVKVEGTLTRPYKLPVHGIFISRIGQHWRGSREIEGMGFGGKGPLKHWDPCERVRCQLATLRDRVSIYYYHQPLEEEDRFNLCPTSWEEVQQRTPVAQKPRGSEDESERTDEALTKQLLRGLPTRRIETPDVTTPPVITSSVTSPTPIFATTVPSTPLQSSTTVFAMPSTSSSAWPHQIIIIEKEYPPENQGSLTVTSLDVSGGIRLPPSLFLKPTIWRAPTFTIPTSMLRSSLTVSPSIELGRMPLVDPIDTGHQEEDQDWGSIAFQTEENLLSLTRKRKRTTWSIDLDDNELIADPVSIVRSANKMLEDAMERMQLELAQGRDKIVVPPSMGSEIVGSIKELYQFFIQIEEARARGEKTHRRIGASLEQVNEWEAKLATLGNVARRNLLPNLSLLEFDEVVTCENVLNKTRQALEDGDAPLVLSNRQLESSSHNIRALLDSAGLPPVVKPDDSFPLETELDAALGEGGKKGGKGPVCQGAFGPCLGRAHPNHVQGGVTDQGARRQHLAD